MRGRTFFLLVQNTVQKEYRNKTLIFLFLFTLFILWMDQTFFDFIKDKLFEGVYEFTATQNNEKWRFKMDQS